MDEPKLDAEPRPDPNALLHRILAIEAEKALLAAQNAALVAAKYITSGEASVRLRKTELVLEQALRDLTEVIDRVALEGWCQECGLGRESREPMLTFRTKLAALREAVAALDVTPVKSS